MSLNFAKMWIGKVKDMFDSTPKKPKKLNEQEGTVISIVENIKELTEITDEAEWVETRVLDLYTTDSTIMTPVQENMYWDSIYNFHKNYDHGAEL